MWISFLSEISTRWTMLEKETVIESQCWCKLHYVNQDQYSLLTVDIPDGEGEGEDDSPGVSLLLPHTSCGPDHPQWSAGLRTSLPGLAGPHRSRPVERNHKIWLRQALEDLSE